MSLELISHFRPRLLKSICNNKNIIAFGNLNPYHLITASFQQESTSNSNGESYDIVISGGGMVGFATGCALGQSKRLEEKKILVLEKQSKRTWSLPSEFSNRVCALNPQTQRFFSDVGVWNLISDMRTQPIKKMQVWESCSEAMISFAKEDKVNVEAIAHIVENDVILDSLKRSIPGNVNIEYGSSVSSYELPQSHDKRAIVTLQDGRKINTELLIGADGAHSGVRKAMNCHYLSWEYDQMGIVATLELSEAEENFTAWQKFLSTGPIALLPLSSSRSSLVWSTTKDKAAKLLALTDDDFIDALNNALWQDESVDPMVRSLHSRLQTFIQTLNPWSIGNSGVKQLPPSLSKVIPRSRASFPLGLGHASRYVAPRVALIGDAAHRVHPLAGQGVNLGFGDVLCLRDTLENAILQGLDIGDPHVLHKYETDRQRHNVASMAAIDGLYRLYSTSFAPVVLLRSIGLSAVDAIRPMKKRIMSHASG